MGALQPLCICGIDAQSALIRRRSNCGGITALPAPGCGASSAERPRHASVVRNPVLLNCAPRLTRVRRLRTTPTLAATVVARWLALCTRRNVLELAIGALVISLIAGALGFTGIARTAATVAKVVFVIFLVVALLLLLLVWGGISLVT